MKVIAFLWRSLVLCVALCGSAWTAPMPGDRLASFALPAPEGDVVSWQPGTVTVFSFCALWCDTWREQRRRLEATAAAARGLPVAFVTISVDGRWPERWRSAGARDRILLDAGGRVSGALGIHTIPYTVVADRRGFVCYAARGVLRADALARAIREAVGSIGRPPPPTAVAAGVSRPRDGVVYLTFDDFPAATGDDDLLDVLRAEHVPATFFCIGRNLIAHPAAVRRAAREGHSLQLHSWSHKSSKPEVERSARALYAVAGVRPTLYRPPGRMAIERLDGSLVPGFVVNPYDYRRPGEEEIVRRVVLASRSGGIVLLHAGVSETRAALPRILAALRRRGLSFGVLN